ncbi:VacJ family lipoprotein [Roseomonas hellenica]|uniref:VacJ family lipoprotein n=1 Tax=Plastoroseomonas hellenica TaxID=2687306 RepID=A0ABS5EUK0_9PROT|nr:VacJ family lipoprotein [Plastoroseomonas hellenica]MBR0663923.1 VacJ family lipoprotein [Plastoroseomonas hellenica]
MSRSVALIRLIRKIFGLPASGQAARRDPAASEIARLDCGWEHPMEGLRASVDTVGTPADRRHLKVLPLLLLLVAAGCAGRDGSQAVAAGEPGDPAESVNRVVFDGNQFVDRTVLRPVASAYREYVPQRIRSSVGNFAANLGEPRTLVNDLLQGNTTRAWNTTQRFAVNTTIGVAGLFDVATDWGLPRHNADFGQTLGVWGVGPGPVTQLPLLGHSNLRDTVGTVAGFFGNPLSYLPDAGIVLAAGTGAGLMDTRARVLPQTDAMEATSLDYYAALRSARAQNRDAVVEEGRQGRLRDRRTIDEP